MIKAKFKFHPVGQGAFYSGKIVLTSRKPKVSKEFNIVYDCGSTPSKKFLNKSIGEYKKELKDNHLDVLLLSHLDTDHVNGVTELLKSITCENIYMPYLTPFQRLILAVLYESEDKIDTSYYNFIKNPHDYLSKISNANIIYILNNTEDDFTVNDNNISERNELNKNFNLVDDLEANEDVGQIKDLEGELSDRIKFKKGNKSIKLGYIWDFYLYHSLHDNALESHRINLRDIFIKEINHTYSIYVDENLTQNQLCDILNDEKKFSKLKLDFFTLNYRYLNQDSRNMKKSEFINESSLMVLHRPLNYNIGTFKKKKSLPPFYNHPKRFEYYTIRRSNEECNQNYGLTLLTGDTGMKQIDSSLYIKDELRKIDFFQVPHHGSNTGYDGSKLSQLKKDKTTSTIINFGYGNNYGHPKEDVLNDLIKNNFDIRFATQFEEFEYEFELRYY